MLPGRDQERVLPMLTSTHLQTTAMFSVLTFFGRALVGYKYFEALIDASCILLFFILELTHNTHQV